MQIRYLAILDLNGKVIVEHTSLPTCSTAAITALTDEKQPDFKALLTKDVLQNAQKQLTPTGLISFKNHKKQQEYYLSFSPQRIYVFVINTPNERLTLDNAQYIFRLMSKAPSANGLAAIAKDPPQGRITSTRDTLEQVKEVMLSNMEKALERGEKIEALADKAEHIGIGAVKFNSATKSLANQQCCSVCCCDICCCNFLSCHSWFKRNCCCCGPCTCNSNAPQKTSYGAVADIDISKGPSPQRIR